jgi:hypothetical protein
MPAPVGGGAVMPVIDPFSPGVWVCWCGVLHTSERAAGKCTHRPPVPFVPGHPESEDALRHAIPYCNPCPGPGVVHQHYAGPRPPVDPRRRRWVRIMTALLVIAAFLAACILGGLSWASTHPAPAPVGIPTTYGPPGPDGGPR